jgi:hypothetical protein
MLRLCVSPIQCLSMSARPEYIAPLEGQSVVPAPLKPWFACPRRAGAGLNGIVQQRSSGRASSQASVRAAPSPSSVRFVTVALANPSLERGPPPACRREALVVYDPPRGVTPVASAQLKR